MGNRLEGRVAIVTGSGRGIGRDTALQLADEGAAVVINDLGGSLEGEGSDLSPAQKVVEEIKSSGGNAVASGESVAEFNTAEKIVQTAIDNFGRVDIMCHVAGILRDRMVFNMTEEDWDSVLKVHLYGAFNMVRHVVPHMIEQNYGRIVLFSSGSGLGASGQANYASAKEGMVGFVRAISRELSLFGITANAVYPGGNTRMAQSVPQSTRDLRKDLSDQAHGGTEDDGSTELSYWDFPEEYMDPANNAPKAAYLCTEAAGNITGQVIGTNGWPLDLYSPRQVIRSIHKNGRWTLKELEDLIPFTLSNGLINPVPPQKK